MPRACRCYGGVVLAALLAGGPAAGRAEQPAGATQRPNIVWIVSEDHGPHLGCYGDAFAATPHADRLAARGLRYRRCWSNAPVCAPARTALITGLYPPSCGAEHMRSMVPLPRQVRLFPALLRAAGYYCTNNAKEDYNVEPGGQVWDESSRQAHWRNRPPGAPFFAVFNSEKSHESRIRARPHQAVHDPAQVRIPAYHPDCPEARQDWAQYYDCVTAADADAGARLDELERAGLLESTIVFYFSDHGSGMPRNKRWPYNAGLHVPLIVFIPPALAHLRPADYREGAASERLVGFVDFAPTVLSLAGIRPPDVMQGTAFLGPFAGPGARHLHGFRGRMDERLDLVRSVTDGRYVYVRNSMPHRIYGQHLDYMFQTPTTRAWKKLHDEGRLNPIQDQFWNRKPPEELYDLERDPDEVQNLAPSAEHRAILERLRRELRRQILETRDLGFMPEGERWRLADRGVPYDLARDDRRYPLERVLETAERASRMQPEEQPSLRAALADDNGTVRYWAALGILMQGEAAVRASRVELQKALTDSSPPVRIVAAEALGMYGGADDRRAALDLLVSHADRSQHSVFTVMDALAGLDALDERAAPAVPRLAGLASAGALPHARYEPYVPRLLTDLRAKFSPALAPCLPAR